MKKINRNLSFTLMGLVALIIYMLIARDLHAPMSLKLSLGTLALFLFLLAISGYLKKSRK